MNYLFAPLLFLFLASTGFAQVRTVTLKNDQLLTVKTALGIATIIQVPDTIQSAVIGDQSGFKVEYLDKAVTIKPLRYGAKTNLYLLTDKKRFNIRLHTLHQDAADYVVYIATNEARSTPVWNKLLKVVTLEGITISVHRTATSKDGLLLIDGSLSSKRVFVIKPEQFWVLQENRSKVIDSLFLTSLEANAGSSVRFGISISLKELESRKPILLQFKGTKVLSLSIGGSEWAK